MCSKRRRANFVIMELVFRKDYFNSGYNCQEGRRTRAELQGRLLNDKQSMSENKWLCLFMMEILRNVSVKLHAATILAFLVFILKLFLNFIFR